MRRTESLSATQKKWAGLIRQQEQSGTAVKVFCENRGINGPSFYSWRKRLGTTEPVRFALVEAGQPAAIGDAPVELIFSSGDRVRISPGTDAATLRTVLSVLREHA